MVPEQFVILNKNMSLTLLLFLIGILGFVFNRKKFDTYAYFYRNNAIIYNILNIGKFC